MFVSKSVTDYILEMVPMPEMQTNKCGDSSGLHMSHETEPFTNRRVEDMSGFRSSRLRLARAFI